LKAGAKGKEPFCVRFWGVRGSYPTSGRETLKFGGHTSCVEILAGEHRLIFDAGTGIIPLGKTLLRSHESPLRLHIFLSHTHHDHLIGFYFFEPLLSPRTRLFIYGPETTGHPLKKVLQTAMDSSLFPIGLEELKARKEIYSLKGKEVIQLQANSVKPKVVRDPSRLRFTAGDVTVWSHRSPDHPKNGVLLYRVSYRSKSVVYATDIEEKNGGDAEVIKFFRGADLLIHDAQYRTSEYLSQRNPRKGWGHSTLEAAVQVAKKANVQRLVLFHHDPTHDDLALEKMERQARRLFPPAVVAHEGMKIQLL